MSLLSQNKKSLFLAAVFIFAFAVRLLVVFALQEDPAARLTGDQLNYDDYAVRIVQGDWLTEQVSSREIGYPFFLSLVYRVFGHSYLAACICNAFLSALITVLIFSLANRLFGHLVAILSSLWSVFYFHFLFYNAFVLREALVTLLFTLFLFLMSVAVDRKRTALCVIATFVFILTVHTDARFLAYTPFIPILLFFLGVEWKTAFRRGLLFMVVFVLLMIPWQVRNYIAYDKFVLINTRTFVWSPGAEGWQDELKSAFGPGAEHLRADEAGERQLTGAKRRLYEFVEFYRIFRFRGEVRPGTSKFIHPWSMYHNLSSILFYGTLLPFFIFGCIEIIRKRVRSAYILVLPIIVHTVIHTLKFGLPRYRMPIEPALIIVAFYGVLELAGRFRRVRPAAVARQI